MNNKGNNMTNINKHNKRDNNMNLINK